MTTNENQLRLQRFERLAEVCRKLGDSADLDKLLQVIVDAACVLTDSEFCAVLLYEEETDLLKFVAGPRSRKETSRRLRVPIDRSLAGWVFSNSKALILQDAKADPRLNQTIESPLGILLEKMVAVPLKFQGDTIGVLEIFNKRNGAYEADDIKILETLASQAAVATLSTLLLEETRRAYDEVNQVEKMKSDFIAIASHELRTPLGLILGHATFLNDAIKDPQERRQIDVIIRSASRLKCIIEDLSNMNTLDQGKLRSLYKKFSVNAVLQKQVVLFRQTAEQKQIRLDLNLPVKIVKMEGDEEKIGIAVANLIANAIAFTNQGGHIQVGLETLSGYVKVNVADDGIGIPPQDLAKVFERFYQVQSHLTRRHGGMGLGLAVAKAMVELHGGQIWVESVEGQGSDFSILLPLKGGATTPLVQTKIPAFLPE